MNGAFKNLVRNRKILIIVIAVIAFVVVKALHVFYNYIIN
jgi:hypothetical protein